MSVINTRLGPMDTSLLQCLQTVEENDDVRVEAIEYCLLDCEGHAHKTGVAQGDGCFCELHVHRGAHGIVKRWPVEAGGVAASLV